jgi:outer membrane protein TolC
MAVKKIKFLIVALLLLVYLFPNTARSQRVLTLEESIQIAEAGSPDIRKSALNLESNKMSLVAQRASLKSRFSLDITPFDFSRTRVFNDFFSTWNTNEDYSSFGRLSISQPIPITDGVLSLVDQFGYRDNYSQVQDIRTKTWSNNIYIQFEQPIFTYNRTKLQLKELELNLENALLSYALQLLNLERAVTQTFYNFYQAQNSLDISRDEFNNHQLSYEITKNKVEAGLLAEVELYQAELNLATSRSTVENNQVNLDNIADDFKLLLGMDLKEDIRVQVDVEYITQNVDINQAIQHGLDERMELRQRQIDIERSEFELIRTNALNEFKGSVSLSLGLFGDDSNFTEVYNSPTNNPRVAVTFSIPLFDWGESEQ